MERRDLLKALPFIPVLLPKAGPVEMLDAGGGDFVMFFDAQAVDINEVFINDRDLDSLPEAWRSIVVVPVILRPGQTISDVVAIYSLKKEEPSGDTQNPHSGTPQTERA